jgi:uncharacterized protein YqjF (DUF2071 family)
MSDRSVTSADVQRTPPGGVPFPTDHRPWPAPDTPWVQTQTWSGLMFAHWPLPVDALRAVVPPSLPLDTFEGQAWIGIVPFYLSNLAMRGLPPVPGLSAFPELNVRTYVTLDDRPGVFFFSLDAGNPPAVAGGRLLHLPYYYAWLTMRRTGDAVSYASRRLFPAGARFRGGYRPVGPPDPPRPGTLEYFLSERYCLYAVDRHGRVDRLEIHHPPWPLQTAEAEIELNTMTAPIPLRLPDTRPLVHYAARQDMVAWLPRTIRSYGRLPVRGDGC